MVALYTQWLHMPHCLLASFELITTWPMRSQHMASRRLELDPWQREARMQIHTHTHTHTHTQLGWQATWPIRSNCATTHLHVQRSTRHARDVECTRHTSATRWHKHACASVHIVKRALDGGCVVGAVVADRAVCQYGTNICTVCKRHPLMDRNQTH
jgi:hypothetical protein